MILNQPNNELSVGLVKEVTLTKTPCINGAQCRVIATATFANVVIKGRHEQQNWVAKAVSDSRRYREFVRVVCPQKPTTVGDDLHGVCVTV